MASAPTLVFPKEVLTPLKGKPDATSLQILQQELYQNARAIPSFLGGGQLGHLGLVMPVHEYLLRPGAQAFHIPVPPGLIPAQAGNATAAQLFEVKRVHDYNSLVFVTYQSVRNALTNQILAAVEPTYLLELCDVDFGFVDADFVPKSLGRTLCPWIEFGFQFGRCFSNSWCRYIASCFG